MAQTVGSFDFGTFDNAEFNSLERDETVTLSDADVRKVNKVLTETVNTSDQYSRVLDAFRTYSDSPTVTDSRSSFIRKAPFEETVTVSDTYLRTLDAFRVYSDSFTVSDSRSTLFIKGALDETVTISDITSKKIKIVRDETVNITDAISKFIRKAAFEETVNISDEYDFFFNEGPGTPPYYATIKIIERGLPVVKFPQTESNHSEEKT